MNMPKIKRLNSQITMIDINLFGIERYGSVYVVLGKKTALIDTGTSYAVSTIIDALAEIGVNDLDYIFLTHIHLDHAGGAGLLAHRYPNAKVVVHHRGSRHLIDPTKLVESVQAATGDMFEYYGEAIPILPEQIIACSGDEQFYLGNDIIIQTVDTPGHAPHHLAFFETKSSSIFVGDAAGLYSEEKLLPATPPPRFDLSKALASLKKLKELKPKHLLYSHFGPAIDPIEALDRYATLLPIWINKINIMRNEIGVEGAVKKVISDLEADDILFSKQMTVHELSMSVRGVPVTDNNLIQ
jgi:glyoxylase-like metal-dependent hydrolase (beta-lactamase superfamily II)